MNSQRCSAQVVSLAQCKPVIIRADFEASQDMRATCSEPRKNGRKKNCAEVKVLKGSKTGTSFIREIQRKPNVFETSKLESYCVWINIRHKLLRRDVFFFFIAWFSYRRKLFISDASFFICSAASYLKILNKEENEWTNQKAKTMIYCGDSTEKSVHLEFGDTEFIFWN